MLERKEKQFQKKQFGYFRFIHFIVSHFFKFSAYLPSMPKIYFIPLLFKGSFAVGDYWRYCTVDWCGGSATVLSIIFKYK